MYRYVQELDAIWLAFDCNEGFYQTAPLMAEIYQPLQEGFDLQPISSRYFGSSDHVAYLRTGGAALMAAWAWNVSELSEAFPHHEPQPTPEL